MSVITKCLENNENTNAYLSFNANKELKQNSKNWSGIVRSNIGLEPDQIEQILIVKIRRHKSVIIDLSPKRKFQSQTSINNNT